MENITLLVPPVPIETAVDLLAESSKLRRRNLQLSGDPHYNPADLKPYLGYDQRAGWLIIVEWFWLQVLAVEEIMPKAHADLLTKDLLNELLEEITMTKVTRVERKKTNHDILALLFLMKKILPRELHRWLHWGLTSYDTICTAYALQMKYTFQKVFIPKLKSIDGVWRQKILETAEILQIGRTHLQDALPMTVGAWFSVLHDRFMRTSMNANRLSLDIPGKFSGAIGTSAAIRASVPTKDLEATALQLLGLPNSRLSTQIVQPESMERFLNETTLLSAVFANLGDDVRHLQSSAIGELRSASSTSSTMSHKDANPIAAENADGMHVTVRAEFLKVLETLNSTLQRDLRYSNVMRGYGAVLVFVYYQMMTTSRLLNSLTVNSDRCNDNFWRNGVLVTAELLHLSLQKVDCPNAHRLVNSVIVPLAKKRKLRFDVVIDELIKNQKRYKDLKQAWQEIPDEVKEQIGHPETYLGDAIKIAKSEAERELVFTGN